MRISGPREPAAGQEVVAVFGATGFIGRAVVESLLARGRVVRALARDPTRLRNADRLIVIAGDVRQPEPVRAVVQDAAAVISCLGVPRGGGGSADFLAQGLASIVAAMRSSGVSRLVAVSGAAVTLPGEVKPLPHRAASRIVRVLARDAVESKQREFGVLLQSPDIEWTAVRPTRVVAGPATGRARISTSAGSVGMRVTAGDLATFIADLVSERAYVREAPFISS